MNDDHGISRVNIVYGKKLIPLCFGKPPDTIDFQQSIACGIEVIRIHTRALEEVIR